MKKRILLFLSYVLVAALASALSFGIADSQAPEQTKLQQLQELIEERFIGEVDSKAIEDAAAAAMVDALGDRWSYYMSAEDYQARMEQVNNAYVGIGITISTQVENGGFLILSVTGGGPAQEAGLLAGDIVTAVEGQSVEELGSSGARNLIRGEEGTQVSITVTRAGTELSFQVERRSIQVIVASGEMLTDTVGLVTIENFDDRCAKETIGAIGNLLNEGAQALIFDVRGNPGGYSSELVEVLDYLLPEGPLFRTLSYKGQEHVDESDANCLEIPMAVLVNGDSYSAAEFFGAALREYDAAILVGTPTTGKGYYQHTLKLNDGSAVGLSTGKYFTPNGVSLAEVGGLTPDILVEVDEKTAAAIASNTLQPQDDPQIQAALKALTEN